MILRQLVQHSTRDFTYDPASTTFIAEASDLRGQSFDRVYDDAADIGFGMVSSRTNKQVVFVLSGQTFDKSHEDLLFWTFKSTCGTYTATIFND